jgi:Protein of unknown function (DUF3047)
MRRSTVTAAAVATVALALGVVLVGCGSAPPVQSSSSRATGTQAGSDSAALSADTPDTQLPSLVGPPAAAARDNAVVAASGALVLPSGWEPWILHPSKQHTHYRLEQLESGVAMRADADSSASGLLTSMRVDPARRPFLEWRWRVDSLIKGADNTDRHAEDAPVRIVLAFDGDKSVLPLRDRLFFERMRLFAGRDLPFATLMYIWENNKPVGAVIKNPHTDRVRKIVVASGPMDLRQWKSFRRNILDDYRLAYGSPPGKLIAVAILTDTDNTKEKATAWYGDIKLLRN